LEEGIDLRSFINAVLKNWGWIIGLTILSGAIAFGVSHLIPPTFKVTALVTIIETGDVVQFDPRFMSSSQREPLSAYPELATSDEILLKLLDQLQPTLRDDVDSLENLRSIVEANASSSPNLIRLSVKFHDAAQSAQIVNAWADLFVERANDLYGNRNGAQVQFFEDQLANAGQELEVAEEALIEFASINNSIVISNTLEFYNQLQADYLSEQSSITFLIQDAQSLQNQFTNQTTGNNANFADSLTTLSLQLNAFNGDNNSLPILMEINADTLMNSSQRDQVAFLNDLVETLESKSSQIDERLTQLEPKILNLNQQLQQLNTEQTRLARNQVVASETFTALARKVEEERITSQDMSSGVRLASRAAVPRKSVSPRTLINVAIASSLGLFLGISASIAYEWWREE